MDSCPPHAIEKCRQCSLACIFFDGSDKKAKRATHRLVQAPVNMEESEPEERLFAYVCCDHFRQVVGGICE
jgi:hypothetical protein